VRREEGLSVLLVITLRCSEKSINPRKKLLSTVIGVENDGDSVLFREGTNVEGSRNGTGDGGSVVFVIKTLSSVELNEIGYITAR
jgi:hypothetical protein